MLEKKHPFYFKSTVILLGLCLTVFILFDLREILVPLAFSLLLAILLNPIVTRFEKWKIHKVIAISLALTIAIIAIIGIGYFIVSQVANFTDEMPTLKKKFLEMLGSLQKWFSAQFGVNLKKQQQYISEMSNDLKPQIGSALGSMAETLGMIFLMPVYTFLFIYYKKLLVNFMYEMFSKENSTDLTAILSQTRTAIQRYMMGLLLEALAVAALNTIALLILGVKYAVLLGVLGAVLNVLPYIGGIIGIALPLIIATITKTGYETQLGIVIAYLVIQFIDNHFLIPWIVSSRVRINALVSIVIVLMGGALWGIPGMFLSIPFTGVLKIVFDQVPDLKPWGKVLGDEVPTKHKGQIWNSVSRAVGRKVKQ
jgi:predicted PurR-regulated permease PerM